MQNLSIERTSEAIVIKLPLNSTTLEIQNLLNYFKYVSIGGASKITSEQINELAQEGKAGWWEVNKHRFIGKEGFEDIMVMSLTSNK